MERSVSNTLESFDLETTGLRPTFRYDLRTTPPDVFVDHSETDWSKLRWKDLGQPYRVENYSGKRKAWEAQHDRSAQRLYRLCVDLKGLYIKAGQFIGTRADLMPYPYVRWLGQLIGEGRSVLKGIGRTGQMEG